MDNIIAFFRTLAGNADTTRVLLSVVAGATVFMFVLGVSFLVLAASDPARRRLSRLADRMDPRHTIVSRILRAIEPVKKYVVPEREGERSRVEKRLAFAGFRSPNAVPLFYAIKTGLSVALLCLVLASSFWLPRLAVTNLLLVAAIAALVGLLIPNVVLDHLIERRQKRLRDGFPDALDMLVVCVEAGLGLTASIQRVSEELRFSHPELASELALATAEMRAGVDRESALRALASRTGLDDVTGLVSLLIQTLRFGTSIADTLRVYAEEFRDKRMQRAEEMAAKIGTKLIFPLIVCLWPAFFVVAIGPAVLKITEVFRTMWD